MQTRNETAVKLTESFKQLVLRMPIEKITIKDITDQAGVIRPTFYHHFQDKYELLESIIRTELLEPMMPLIKNGMMNAAITIIFFNMQKEREFYRRAGRLEGQNSFEEITRNCIREVLYDFLNEETQGKPGQGSALLRKFLTADNLADYYANAMTFLVMRWLNQDLEVAPAEMAEIYEFLMTHSMDEMIEEMIGEFPHND